MATTSGKPHVCSGLVVEPSAAETRILPTIRAQYHARLPTYTEYTGGLGHKSAGDEVRR